MIVETSASIVGIFLSIALPWFTGNLVSRYFLGPGYPASLYLGHGYLLGNVAVIVWMGLFDVVGVPLYFWPILMAVLATGVIFTFLVNRKVPTHRVTMPCPQQIHKARLKTGPSIAQWMVAGLLAVLTLIQLKFIHDEILLRPTFPWDAWRGWEPETLQHFNSRSLSADMQTVSNYGAVASQVHLWTMLAAGVDKAAVTHIPWLLAYIAIGLTVYGQLRIRFGVLQSALGSFACLSLPYLMIHASLAGYADIWLTLAFTLGVFSIALIRKQGRSSVLMLVAIYIITTLLSKRAGLPMGLSLLACMFFVLVRWTPARAALVASVPLFLSAFLIATTKGYFHLNIELPLLGLLEFNESYIRLPLLSKYTFDVSLNLWPYVEAVFLYANWHLGTFLLVACSLALVFRREIVARVAVHVFAMFSALVFILGFFLALDPDSAQDQTALSRTLLYLSPLLAYTITSIACSAFLTSPRARDSVSC